MSRRQFGPAVGRNIVAPIVPGVAGAHLDLAAARTDRIDLGLGRRMKTPRDRVPRI